MSVMPDISYKQMRVKKLIDYAEKWDLEDYKYVGICLDGRLIPTNNLDCDGLRYFNHVSFLNYINDVMMNRVVRKPNHNIEVE